MEREIILPRPKKVLAQPFDDVIAFGVRTCAQEILASKLDEPAVSELAHATLLAYFGAAWADVCFWLRTRHGIEDPKAHLIHSVSDSAMRRAMGEKT